nr:hypothetical protein [Tanacetum cinerariifolium]
PLNDLRAIAYSSSSLPNVEVSSLLDSFLAFKAMDLSLSLLPLKISESFSMITSFTLGLPINSSGASDDKSFDYSTAVTFALHFGYSALRNFPT